MKSRRYSGVTNRWVQPVWDYRSWKAREERREALVKKEGWVYALGLIPLLIYVVFKLPL